MYSSDVDMVVNCGGLWSVAGVCGQLHVPRHCFGETRCVEHVYIILHIWLSTRLAPLDHKTVCDSDMSI